jgi:excisionase family DNA binding protein
MSNEIEIAAQNSNAGFIDEKELLRRLPVSRRTIHNWRTSGKIPSIKIGRRILFCWENVSAALRRLERGVE